MTEYYKRITGNDYNEKSLIFIKSEKYPDIIAMRPQIGKYNAGPNLTRPGQVFYDHEASAALNTGPENWNFPEFAEKVSNCPGQDIATKALTHFDDFEAEYGDPAEIEREKARETTAREIAINIAQKHPGGEILVKTEDRQKLVRMKLTPSNLGRLLKVKPQDLNDILRDYFTYNENIE